MVNRDSKYSEPKSVVPQVIGHLSRGKDKKDSGNELESHEKCFYS